MDFNREKPDAFWRELVEQHVLSPELVEEHRIAARESPWIPLGKIMMREGVLTVRQVMGLVSIQADEPNIRIGDLAVREGLCTPEDIARCLDVQRQSAPGPIQLLLRDERVSSDRLMNSLVGYIHHLEGRLTSLTEALEKGEGVEPPEVAA